MNEWVNKRSNNDKGIFCIKHTMNTFWPSGKTKFNRTKVRNKSIWIVTKKFSRGKGRKLFILSNVTDGREKNEMDEKAILQREKVKSKIKEITFSYLFLFLSVKKD